MSRKILKAHFSLLDPNEDEIIKENIEIYKKESKEKKNKNKKPSRIALHEEKYRIRFSSRGTDKRLSLVRYLTQQAAKEAVIRLIRKGCVKKEDR